MYQNLKCTCGAIAFVQMLLLPSSLLNRVPTHIWRSDKNVWKNKIFFFTKILRLKRLVVARNISAFKTCACLPYKRMEAERRHKCIACTRFQNKMFKK